MPRPTEQPRLVFEPDRGTWTIRHASLPGRRKRLGLPRGEADAAQKALAEFILSLGTAAPTMNRPLHRVFCAEGLEPYLARRTDSDPAIRKKSVERPKELVQQISKLAEFWSARPISDVNERTCEEFTAFVRSPSYARKLLAIFQSALNEARRAGIIREVITVTLPKAPRPREDYLTHEEFEAFAWTCFRHRDAQKRRTKEGLREVVGSKRPWLHVLKFGAVAVATCSRSARVFEAAYHPEPGRPLVDLHRGILYRSHVGEDVTRKRAPPVRLNARLVASMRRWSTDRVINGKLVKGDRYVVEWAGRPADCKGAFTEAMRATMKARPDLFKRRDGSQKKIVRHSLRHTGITWLAQDPALSVEQICAFAGITRGVFDRVYAHHHEAAQAAIVEAQARKRRRPRKPEPEDDA